MSAEGDARRARLGPRLVKAAQDAVAASPPLSPQALAALAVLIRGARPARRNSDAA